jgi:TRAP-type mannitol/chloroaromatic compound transport system substrate-binding protein
MTLDRRSFITGAGAVSAAAATQAVAQAPALPSVRWRMTSSFPKSLDTIYGGAETLAKRVDAITGGKFKIQVFAAGEIVPAFQAADAVQNLTVESCHTASYYFVGKNKAWAFDTTLPFGLNQRQQNAWIYHGGGLQLVREFFRDYSIISFPGGNTGVQMGGWWRKEVKTLADLKGVKFRIAGLGGDVCARLGVIPQQIPGGDIFPALERGTIDGAEWIGPYDDEKLGLNKVAPHYYYPGWWESNSMYSFYVNIKEWEKLPKEYQAAFEAAAYETNLDMRRSTTSRIPRRCARSSPRARSCTRSPPRSCRRRTRPPTSSTTRKRARTPRSRRSTSRGGNSARSWACGTAWRSRPTRASCSRSAAASRTQPATARRHGLRGAAPRAGRRASTRRSRRPASAARR